MKKWKSLHEKDRFDSLPLILAGPILRRVTHNSVTVWIVLKENQTLCLEVKDDSLEKNTILKSEETSPIKIGQNLFITCVTANAVSNDKTLKEGQIYTYNLQVGNVDFKNIIDFVVTYNNFSEPSFVLPPNDKKQLRICQGSCRKPHGPGRDAMAILDNLIKANATDPIKRPQMLVLTGDQIYADDVADALLYMIMDASSALIKSSENISEFGDINMDNINAKPGQRASLLREKIHFTSGVPEAPNTPKSHLLTFGEYILMYVFVWSDVLWDGGCLPDDFKTITGKSPYTYKNNKDKDGNIIEVKYETSEYITFLLENSRLKLFYKDLTNIRRALANIPVYMILDDHEVTDDWNLNMDWCNKVLKNDGGRHIIANSLAAYTFCQSWGNVPDRFNSLNSNEFSFLKNITDGTYLNNHSSLEAFFLPQIDSIVNDIRELNAPPKEIKWNYKITFDCFELIAIDTRTKRWFPKRHENSNEDIWFPILISESSLMEQIQDFNKDFVIVAFAPPFFGIPLMEWKQSGKVNLDEMLEIDCESPGLQNYFFQRFLSRIFVAMCGGSQNEGDVLLFSGDVHYGFSNLTNYICKKPFKEIGEYENKKIRVLQLTASAFKNEVDKMLYKFGLKNSADPKIAPILAMFKYAPKYLGFNKRETTLETVRNKIKLKDISVKVDEYYKLYLSVKRMIDVVGSDAILVDVSTIDIASEIMEIERDWEYETIWIADFRPRAEREFENKNRFIVQGSNLGMWEPSGENGIFSLYWYYDDSIPSKTATQYEFKNFFKVQ